MNRLSQTIQVSLFGASTPIDFLVQQFRKWFAEASECTEIEEPNAMTLATANNAGVPNCRIVLMKGFDETGFVFYTNYQSRKGRELAENPKATLLFYWHPLQRQVRINGDVTKVAEQESDDYFASRPFKSRLAAAASRQSEAIPSREYLHAQYNSLLDEYKEEESEFHRPLWWGGYRVKPVSLEFWQGGVDRLHDRLIYTKEQEGWKLQRLSP